MVLWVGAMIVLLAGAYGYGTRSESRVIEELRQASVLRAASEAALHHVAATLLEQRAPRGQDAQVDKMPVNGRPWEWTFSDRALEIRVVGTGGLVDLNRAPRSLVQEALSHAGLSAGEVGAVLDVLDSAESKRGVLESLRELGAAAGLDRMQLDSLIPLMTVHGGNGIVPEQAPAPVLEMLSGGDAQVAAELVEAGNAGAERVIPAAYLSAGSSGNYVVSVAVPRESKRSMTAVISVPGRNGHLYSLLE